MDENTVFDLEWAKRGGVVCYSGWTGERLLKFVTMGTNEEAIYSGQDGEELIGYDQTVGWFDFNGNILMEQSIGGMFRVRMATRAECESAGVEYIERPMRPEYIGHMCGIEYARGFDDGLATNKEVK